MNATLQGRPSSVAEKFSQIDQAVVDEFREVVILLAEEKDVSAERIVAALANSGRTRADLIRLVAKAQSRKAAAESLTRCDALQAELDTVATAYAQAVETQKQIRAELDERLRSAVDEASRLMKRKFVLTGELQDIKMTAARVLAGRLHQSPAYQRLSDEYCSLEVSIDELEHAVSKLDDIDSARQLAAAKRYRLDQWQREGEKGSFVAETQAALDDLNEQIERAEALTSELESQRARRKENERERQAMCDQPADWRDFDLD